MKHHFLTDTAIVLTVVVSLLLATFLTGCGSGDQSDCIVFPDAPYCSD